jgi:hypothetical protein
VFFYRPVDHPGGFFDARFMRDLRAKDALSA